jgi:hypothetical protein
MITRLWAAACELGAAVEDYLDNPLADRLLLVAIAITTVTTLTALAVAATL